MRRAVVKRKPLSADGTILVLECGHEISVSDSRKNKKSHDCRRCGLTDRDSKKSQHSLVRAQFTIHPGLDLAVEQHARRAGISKEQMYERLVSRALDLFSICDACVMGTCTSIFHTSKESSR